MRGLEEIGLDIVHALRRRSHLLRELDDVTARLDGLNAEAQSIYDRPASPQAPAWPNEDARPISPDAVQTAVLRPNWLDRGVPAPRVCPWCPDPENWDERAHPNGQHGHMGTTER